MAKTDYEGAWKEFRREYSHKYIHGTFKKRSTADTHLIANLMDDLEQSYTNNYTETIEILIELDNFIRNKIEELTKGQN